MKALYSWFKENWMSNMVATIAIVYSATQFTEAVQAWANHQPANWREGFVSLLVAACGYIMKDFNTHSTQAQTAAKTATVEGQPNAPALVVEANKQVEQQPKP